MCNCSLRAISSLIALLVSLSVNSQVRDDFGLWATLAFNKDISKKTDLSIYQEVRMENRAQVVGRTFTNIGLDHKLKKWLRLGMNYRFILNKRNDDRYGQRHRIMSDIVFRGVIQRFTLSYRARLQWEVKGVNYEREFGHSPSYDFRNTGKVSYTWNRQLEPYFSLDLRFLIRGPYTPYLQGFDRQRMVAGIEILMASNRTLDIFLLSSQDWNVVEPDRLFVIGFQISFGSSGRLIGS